MLPTLGELRYMRRFLDEVSAIEERAPTPKVAAGPVAGTRISLARSARKWRCHASSRSSTPRPGRSPIGIDLGTTNSLVARVRDGRPLVIADCNGKRLVPSVVHYDERGDAVVGRQRAAPARRAPARDASSASSASWGAARTIPRPGGSGRTGSRRPRTPEEAKSVRFKVRDRGGDARRGVGGDLEGAPHLARRASCARWAAR